MDSLSMLIIVTCCILAPIIMLVLYEKYKKDRPDDETLKAWANDPANWKAYFLYYNKADKRIFPPKRTKLGWTVNFANPYSVLAFIVVMVYSFLVIAYFTGILPWK